jgi:hypothetical protein
MKKSLSQLFEKVALEERSASPTKGLLPSYVKQNIVKNDPEWHVLYIPSLDDEGLKKLIKLLNKHHNPYITTLKLTNGNITNNGITHFATMPQHISRVILTRQKLSGGAAMQLVQVFKHVKYLDVSDNHLSRSDAAYFALHCTQRCLNVAGNINFNREDLDNIYARTEENVLLENKKMGGTQTNGADINLSGTCDEGELQSEKSRSQSLLIH